MAKREKDTYGGAGHNLPPEMRAAMKAADKLQSVAERTIADAQAEYDRPRLMNTARRARMGSGVQEEQQRRIANAKTALQIAEALRDGRAGPLAKVTSLADVERLQNAYRSGLYANKAKRDEWRGSMVGVEPDKGDIRHVKPTAGVHAHISPSDIKDYHHALSGNRKIAKDLARLAKLSERDNWQHSNPKDIQAIANVAKALKDVDPSKLKYAWQKRSFQWTANKWLGAVREYEAQKRLGLADPKSLRAMLEAYADARVNRPGADPVKAAERALIGTKIPGYFPTPESLAKRMADLADIKSGQTVLEPSAGSGRLADVAKARGANVEAVEVASSLRSVLEKKGHKLIGSDFTEITPEAKYDRILMNPPFEKRADAEHVRRAYEHLKPGGKMVAVMGEGVFFGSDTKAQQFRTWLSGVGGTSEKLPEGTFKESNTGVNTRLVVIEKPAAAPTAANVQAAMQAQPSNAKPVDPPYISPAEINERYSQAYGDRASLGATAPGSTAMSERRTNMPETVHEDVRGVPTQIRPGADGDPFKYKSKWHETVEWDKDGYPGKTTIVHAATLEEYESKLRAIDEARVAAGEKPRHVWDDKARAASAEARAGHNNPPAQTPTERHAAAVDAYNQAMRKGDYSEIKTREAEMRSAFDELKATQTGTGADKPAWARAKLDFKHLDKLTDQELTSIQRQIMEDPASQNPDHVAGKSIHIYNKKAKAKLDRIGQEISYRIGQKKRAEEQASAAPKAKDAATMSAVERAIARSNEEAAKRKPALLPPPSAAADAAPDHLYHLVAHNHKTGRTEQMNATPMTHDRAMVMKSKMTTWKDISYRVVERDSPESRRLGLDDAAAPRPEPSTTQWLNDREQRISASKAAGNQHLDSLPRAVEGMRGVPFRNVHDPKERGVVRTVANTGEVVVDWADEYSAKKNLAETVKDGKKTVSRSWLAPTDLKDYVAEPKAAKASKAISPTSTVKMMGIPADGGKPFVMAILDMAGDKKVDAERVWNQSAKSYTQPLSGYRLEDKAGNRLHGFQDEATLNAALKAQGKAEKGKSPRTDADSPRTGGKSPHTVATLRAEAKAAGIKGASKMTKGALMKALNKVGAVAMVAAPVTAAVLAYDAKKSEAQAAGASTAKATGSAVAAGAVAGGTVAAVGYGIGKGMVWGVKGLTAAAPLAGKIAARALPGVGVAMMAYGAYQGWKKHGVKGAALGAIGADGLLDRKAAPVQGRLTAEQSKQFAAANAAHNAMQAAPSNTVTSSGKGFANPVVQAAAQQALGRTYDPGRKAAP